MFSCTLSRACSIYRYLSLFHSRGIQCFANSRRPLQARSRACSRIPSLRRPGGGAPLEMVPCRRLRRGRLPTKPSFSPTYPPPNPRLIRDWTRSIRRAGVWSTSAGAPPPGSVHPTKDARNQEVHHVGLFSFDGLPWQPRLALPRSRAASLVMSCLLSSARHVCCSRPWNVPAGAHPSPPLFTSYS